MSNLRMGVHVLREKRRGSKRRELDFRILSGLSKTIIHNYPKHECGDDLFGGWWGSDQKFRCCGSSYGSGGKEPRCIFSSSERCGSRMQNKSPWTINHHSKSKTNLRVAYSNPMSLARASHRP